jgi:hypothetical protein
MLKVSTGSFSARGKGGKGDASSSIDPMGPWYHPDCQLRWGTDYNVLRTTYSLTCWACNGLVVSKVSPGSFSVCVKGGKGSANGSIDPTGPWYHLDYQLWWGTSYNSQYESTFGGQGPLLGALPPVCTLSCFLASQGLWGPVWVAVNGKGD